MEDFTEFLKTLEEPIVVEDAPKPTYPCMNCGGSGEVKKSYGSYMRGFKTYVNKCKSCKGKGHFTTSPEVRKKAKDQKIARSLKAKKMFTDEHPLVIPKLREFAKWSSFAESLLENYMKYDRLTEKQTQAVYKMMQTQKDKANWREKIKTPKGKVPLTKLMTLFENVNPSVINPKFRFENIIISKAKVGSKNFGGLYVKSNDGIYYGKIINDDFFDVKDTPSNVLGFLQDIAKDPHKSAVKYGREQGRCSMCGRILDRKDSISRGYGPVCADNFGLPL